MKLFQRSLNLVALLSLAAAQACSLSVSGVPSVDGSAAALGSSSSATPAPGATPTTAAASPAAPGVTAPVSTGSPVGPVDESDAEDLDTAIDELDSAIDDLDTAIEEWNAYDWAEESADYDWEENDEEEALEIAVRDIDYFGESDEDQDGTTDYHALAYVKAGESEHKIELDEDDQPVSSDKADVLRLTDRSENDLSTFAADQEFNSFTIQHEGAKLHIEFADGDEILVEGVAHRGIDAAAQAIVAHPVGQGVSLHSLAFLQGLLLRRPAEATRGAPACNAPMAATIDRYRAQYRLPVRYKVQSVQDPLAERPHALVKAVVALRLDVSIAE